MDYKNIKRILDILLSLFFIITLSPIFLVTGLVVILESKGPIIFKQERLGKDGKIFNIYKFRSMAKDNNVLNFKEKDKVTRVGKFMRKYGIDELPQLFNILAGDMSLIGPRPQLVKYLEYYTNVDKRRLNVLPGILGPNTCLSEKKNILEKNKLDVYYADNLSLKQDFGIVLTFIINLLNVFKFREEGAKGNKVTVEEELEYLIKNYSKEKTEKLGIESINLIEDMDDLNLNNSDIKLTRKRIRKNYGRKHI